MIPENALIANDSVSLHTGSFLDVSERSIVRLAGRDAQDLLQRLSTNDISKLEVGGVVQTILTNEKGRIVDVLTVLKTEAESLLLFGQTKGGEELQGWLAKYIIMEDAMVENVTVEHAHFLIYDALPKSSSDEWLQSPSGQLKVLEGTDSHAVSFAEEWNSTVLYHVVTPRSSREAITTILQEEGFKYSSPREFETYRVHQLIPAFPNELSNLYNPMEAGLLDFISFTKGCYIGQEVIARLDTYKKVQQKLVQLELGAPPEKLPENIHGNKEVVGSITSLSDETSASETIALGYVKTNVLNNFVLLFFLKGNEQVSVQERIKP